MPTNTIESKSSRVVMLTKPNDVLKMVKEAAERKY